jgi:hypothetical protein
MGLHDGVTTDQDTKQVDWKSANNALEETFLESMDARFSNCIMNYV